jgi:hypothetical protein
MILGKIWKGIKKGVSTVAGVVGIGGTGVLASGGVLTGDVIVDGLLIVGCFILIIINGKEGVPDWMQRLAEKKLANKEDK